ncbi:site-specific integrase [Escherichia coli]|uniref:site-specific integrase n=1 Tax=Escherichia coli TaxID=562 RepID=UPI00025150AB|nr:site-specific integrase [Escherichia coli]EEV5746833.1 site-specific integrase [Escherichia coli]EEV7150739.1 site-specific integrase [Escherichia coli]EEW2728598.1 site-specific integrase [Escherichia coli]EEY5222116.1 site-specific integrase [Escherichia coli]EEY7591614.1 site-specific integrase [Escherichia coli]
MAQRDNLYRRSSGIYVLRITVPVRYRTLIGQREIHASTRTTRLANARTIAARLLAKWYASLEEFKQVDKEKIRGNAPLLAGAGKISLALFCESFDVGLETVVPHLLADNIPLYAFVDSQRGFLIDDFTAIDRDPDTHGFVLNDIAHYGSEAMVNGYMQIYMPLHALKELKKGLSTEITAFRANNGNPLALWLLDLPGVAVDSSSLFINNVQAEKLRSMWDRALAKSEPDLPPAPAVMPTPPPPPVIVANPFCNPLHASKMVSEVLEEFIAYKNSGDLKLASEEKIRSRISHFIDVMGDLTLAELDRNVVKNYVARMQRMPSNLYLMQRRYAAEDLDQLIEKALDAGESLMTKDAIGRHMASLGSMLKWACKETYLIANPVENVLAKRKKTARSQDDRYQFDDDELELIFSAYWFKTGEGVPNKFGRYIDFRPYRYWLPLLALYSGGRMNELCQLYLSDIRMSENGVAYLDFNLDSPDKVMDTEAGAGKSLKTLNALRQVPIHPRLIELGFLEYVKALKADGQERVFPELTFNKIKGYRGYASKWFNELYFGKKLELDRNGKKVFHSFRHNYVNSLDRLELSERMIAQLVGHVRGNTTAMTTYRKDRAVEDQFHAISGLTYNLPEIAPFNVEAGLKAMKDGVRKHK